MEIQFNNFKEIREHFKTELTCILTIEEQRWGKIPKCPYCGSIKHILIPTSFKHPELKDYRDYSCYNCHKTFSGLTGTIFGIFGIELKYWFLAIYILSTHKIGICYIQLCRDLNIDDKTATKICEVLSVIFGNDAVKTPDEIVQVAITYIGGKKKNMHWKKRMALHWEDNKTPVIGIIRKGTIITEIIEGLNQSTVMKIVEKHTSPFDLVITNHNNVFNKIKKSRMHIISGKAYKSYIDEYYANPKNFWSMINTFTNCKILYKVNDIKQVA